MGRGAPNKKGLTYFPKMIDFYEDDKIFDLLDRYGPLGVTVYDCILCIVYKHGYYAEIPLDKLSKMIIKMIGNKWVKSQKAVVQVVHFCSEIGLLDAETWQTEKGDDTLSNTNEPSAAALIRAQGQQIRQETAWEYLQRRCGLRGDADGDNKGIAPGIPE